MEGEVGRFRRNRLVPVPRVGSLAELNGRIAAADLADDARHVEHRVRTVGQDFQLERGLLRPLPAERFPTGLELRPMVDRYARITVRQARYSVPARLIGRRVRVLLGASELGVFDGRLEVARHARSPRKFTDTLVLDHYLEVLVRKPGALAGSTALAQARATGAFTSGHEAFWALCRQRLGDADGTRMLVEALLLHRHLPHAAVVAGLAAAAGVGAASADVVAVEARRHHQQRRAQGQLPAALDHPPACPATRARPPTGGQPHPAAPGQPAQRRPPTAKRGRLRRAAHQPRHPQEKLMSPARRGVTEQAADAAIDQACRLLRLPTIRDRFAELADVARRQQLTYRGFLAELLMAECDDRDRRRSTRRVKEAGFPRPKALDDFDFGANPAINPATIHTLASCAWIRNREPLCLIGDSGTGKSHLLIGLGTIAAQSGYRVRYVLAAKLVNELVEAADDRQLTKTIARYGRVDLLCIDELGYMDLDRRGAELLFQVLTEREERNSVAIASNESFGEWTKTFTDPRLCAAIVDRLTFGGNIIETGTSSYRLAHTRRQRAAAQT